MVQGSLLSNETLSLPPRLTPSPMNRLFEVHELPVRVGPACFALAVPSESLIRTENFPHAALPQAGRIASGRGTSGEECRLSCLGEAAELASCCSWRNERLVTGTDEDMGPEALPPEVLNGFAPHQIRDREAWNRSHAHFDWRPQMRDPRDPLDWLAIEDAFGGRGAFVAADCAFIGRKEAGERDAVAIADSNGCAAGPTAELARFAAVCELVERDATGRWWYASRRRAPIHPSDVEGAAELTDCLAERSRRTWLFDITTDLAIPVMAAVSAERDGRDVAAGFAAGLDAHSAAISALTEMLQMEVSLDAARCLGEEAGSWAYWRRRVRMAMPPLDAALFMPPEPLQQSLISPSGSELSKVLEACERAGIDLWFADMTRPVIGVPAVRAFSTRLCHYKPRFARPRLLAADRRDRQTRLDAPELRPLLVI